MKTPSARGQSIPLGADQSPYVRLYQAVIFRAMQDLTQKQHRAEARRWLLSPESDSAFAKAEISPDVVRRQMTEIEEDETQPTVLREAITNFTAARIGVH